jgi:hypothetical protein
MYMADLPADSNPVVDATLRLSSAATSTERTALTSAGAVVMSTVGEIVTIQAPARSLYEVADLHFVLSVEIATPLFPEA